MHPWIAALAASLILVILWDAFETMILSRRVSRKFRPLGAEDLAELLDPTSKAAPDAVPISVGMTIEQAEVLLIRQTLAATGGNKTAAAGKKTIVMTLVDRQGEARTVVVPDIQKDTLEASWNTFVPILIHLRQTPRVPYALCEMCTQPTPQPCANWSTQAECTQRCTLRLKSSSSKSKRFFIARGSMLAMQAKYR